MLINRPAVRTTVVFLVALLTAGCGASGLTEPSERPEPAEQRQAAQPDTTVTQPTAGTTQSSFPTPEPILLDALIEAGKLRIEAGPNDTTDVAVGPTDPARSHDVETARKTVVHFESATLTIKTPQRPASWNEPGSIQVRVTLPERSNLKVRVSVADVEATGQLNRAELESSTGNLNVGHATDVVSSTASGNMRLGNVTQAANLKTATGSVYVDKAGSSVQILTASGGVRIGAVWQGQVLVQGTTSHVHIGVPSGVVTWLDLDSLGGQVHSAFEPAARAGAALKIHVRTTNGDIDVVHS